MGKKDPKEKLAELKTNAMRLLDGAKIPYTVHCYADTDAVSGLELVAALGENPAQVCKTLVTVGKSGGHYVFVLPVDRELDLGLAARAVGEKYVVMLPSKELLPLTGYVHGGCSPLGMKKRFPTVFHESVKTFPTVMFSAGKIGYQVELSLDDLEKILPFSFENVAIKTKKS